MMTAETTAFQLLLILVGLALLYFGAEGLVRGSSSIGIRLGLTPLVVGLTIVAYGTSTPELFVGVQAAFEGKGDIVIGNVVGANILNIALMLGVAALIQPQQVKLQLIRLDVPVVTGVFILFTFWILDGHISRLEGLVFFTGIAGYTVFNILKARKETSQEIQREFQDEIPQADGNLGVDMLFILGGFVLLALGSSLLVDNAVALATSFGVSEVVVALTIVALGTTSPELATASVAAYKKESDIVFGNSIGSCLYNILCVVGVSAIVAPIHAPGISLVDLGMMIFMAVVLLPLMRTGFVLQRWEGALLICIYAGYLVYLWPK